VEQSDKTMSTEANLAYANWYAQDQQLLNFKYKKKQLLNFLFNSVTKEVLGQIAMETLAASAWRAILGMFSSQSWARIVHLRSMLSGTRKGESTTCVAYYTKMKGFADEMVAVGKRLDDEEVITYILIGLDFEYNSFVEAFTAKTEPHTLNDLYSQHLTAEAWVEAQKEHQLISANVAFHGGRGGHAPSCGRGDGGGYRGGRGSDHGTGGCGNGNKVPCQVCGKTGHTTLRCYKRFDANYNGDDKHANTATTGYNIDTD
jgi:uncharacterized membrane protein YgcG